MSRIETTTNFRDSGGVDLGKKLITKDYLLSVYPSIAQQLGKTPELWIWGFSDQAQLGTNNTTSRSTPVTTFAGGSNWKQVSADFRSTSAIKTDGTLWVWGSNNYARLGINATGARSTPVTTFAGGTNWKQVSGGFGHKVAIKTDGTLWSWGINSFGVLGDNANTTRSTPVTTFAGGTNWKQVSASQYHTSAIKTDGTLWVWGQNQYSQIGINATGARSTPVTTFAGGTNWKQVACGSSHIAAIKTDGTLWTWGRNSFGGLGNNANTTRSTPVTTFAGGTNWKQVSCGGVYTAAIKTDGTLWVWGYNTYAGLGDNTTIHRSTPVTTFAGGTNWKQVSCGGYHTTAIKTDGTLWTWGYGSRGELGDSNLIAKKSTPATTFAGGTNWKQVSGADSHTAAIQSLDFI